MTAADLDLINRERVVARVLSAAVHDARNALQGISGTAELLTMGVAPAQSEDRARGILRQAAWLGERLEHLLQANGDPPLGRERLDVARVFARALDLRTASWGRLGLKAPIDVPQGLLIHADITRTVRILLNLLLNAERALTGSGAGTIALTAEAAGAHVRLIVEDSGPGVSADNEPLLFTTTNVHGRLATGLAASRELAHQMTGSLEWMGPARRAGFVLTLPIGI